MEYSKLASGQVSSVGGATTVVLPFLPNYIEISNATRAAATGVTRAWWQTNMGQGAAFLVTSDGTQDLTTYIASATGGGFSTFQGGIALQYGAAFGISGITKANPAVVTTTASHGYVSGNVVTFYGLAQSATTGMQQICGIPFMVTVTGATTFTIPWNTNQSAYTALSGSPTGAFVKRILYPQLYAPGVAFLSAVTVSGTAASVTTTAPHNFSVGQMVAFRVPSSWGMIELNSLPNVLIPGAPNYGYVTAVGSSTTATVTVPSGTYTAFTTNVTVATALAGGLTFPQVLAVGDLNSGSLLSNFTSPSFYDGTSTSARTSINGPVVAGAFSNNTSMGFIIGASVAGTASDVISWRAYANDYNP